MGNVVTVFVGRRFTIVPLDQLLRAVNLLDRRRWSRSINLALIERETAWFRCEGGWLFQFARRDRLLGR